MEEIPRKETNLGAIIRPAASPTPASPIPASPPPSPSAPFPLPPRVAPSARSDVSRSSGGEHRGRLRDSLCALTETLLCLNLSGDILTQDHDRLARANPDAVTLMPSISSEDESLRQLLLVRTALTYFAYIIRLDTKHCWNSVDTCPRFWCLTRRPGGYLLRFVACARWSVLCDSFFCMVPPLVRTKQWRPRESARESFFVSQIGGSRGEQSSARRIESVSGTE